MSGLEEERRRNQLGALAFNFQAFILTAAWHLEAIGIEVGDDAADFAAGGRGCGHGLEVRNPIEQRGPRREGSGREAPRVNPCRTEQASAAFGCSSPGPWRENPLSTRRLR
jgi:hypothetical protein